VFGPPFEQLGLANFDLNIGSAYDKKRSAALVLQDYRDAELKHGRLAMLAAVAWPLQEKLNPILAAQLRWPNLVAETGGLSPSVLNGGLEQGVIPGAVITFALLVSLVEAQGLRIKKSDGDDWLPGDYGTLRIAEKGTEQCESR
jgi:light-harvesting complex I chlorophyll a/b binding protein 1